MDYTLWIISWFWLLQGEIIEPDTVALVGLEDLGDDSQFPCWISRKHDDGSLWELFLYFCAINLLCGEDTIEAALVLQKVCKGDTYWHLFCCAPKHQASKSWAHTSPDINGMILHEMSLFKDVVYSEILHRSWDIWRNHGQMLIMVDVTLVFSWLFSWTGDWTKNGVAGDLRHNDAHVNSLMKYIWGKYACHWKILQK